MLSGVSFLSWFTVVISMVVVFNLIVIIYFKLLEKRPDKESSVDAHEKMEKKGSYDFDKKTKETSYFQREKKVGDDEEEPSEKDGYYSDMFKDVDKTEKVEEEENKGEEEPKEEEPKQEQEQEEEPKKEEEAEPSEKEEIEKVKENTETFMKSETINVYAPDFNDVLEDGEVCLDPSMVDDGAGYMDALMRDNIGKREKIEEGDVLENKEIGTFVVTKIEASEFAPNNNSHNVPLFTGGDDDEEEKVDIVPNQFKELAGESEKKEEEEPDEEPRREEEEQEPTRGEEPEEPSEEPSASARMEDDFDEMEANLKGIADI
jgi:hypothetical protein